MISRESRSLSLSVLHALVWHLWEVTASGDLGGGGSPAHYRKYGKRSRTISCHIAPSSVLLCVALASTLQMCSVPGGVCILEVHRLQEGSSLVGTTRDNFSIGFVCRVCPEDLTTNPFPGRGHLVHVRAIGLFFSYLYSDCLQNGLVLHT